mgnify:CR=1 FL=1
MVHRNSSSSSSSDEIPKASPNASADISRLPGPLPLSENSGKSTNVPAAVPEEMDGPGGNAVLDRSREALPFKPNYSPSTRPLSLDDTTKMMCGVHSSPLDAGSNRDVFDAALGRLRAEDDTSRPCEVQECSSCEFDLSFCEMNPIFTRRSSCQYCVYRSPQKREDFARPTLSPRNFRSSSCPRRFSNDTRTGKKYHLSAIADRVSRILSISISIIIIVWKSSFRSFTSIIWFIALGHTDISRQAHQNYRARGVVATSAASASLRSTRRGTSPGNRHGGGGRRYQTHD